MNAPTPTLLALPLIVALALVGCGEDATETCAATICSPGEQACEGAEEATCNADGTGWTYQPCGLAFHCSGKVCAPRACTDLLAATCSVGGVSLCAADGLARSEIACGSDEVCLGGACVAPSCTDGDAVCGGAASLLTCSDGGWNVEQCPAGQACGPDDDGNQACRDQICTPWARRCAGGAALTCAADGLSEERVECGSEICKAGACLTSVCGLDDNHEPAPETDAGPIDEPPDVVVGPTLPFFEFVLAGADKKYDLDLTATYTTFDDTLTLQAQKGAQRMLFIVRPLNEGETGSWVFGELTHDILICFADGTSGTTDVDLCPPGHSHKASAFTLTIPVNDRSYGFVEGTFEATMTDVGANSLQITGGTFRLPY